MNNEAAEIEAAKRELELAKKMAEGEVGGRKGNGGIEESD
jgi:hypothetical protein